MTTTQDEHESWCNPDGHPAPLDDEVMDRDECMSTVRTVGPIGLWLTAGPRVTLDVPRGARLSLNAVRRLIRELLALVDEANRRR